MFLYQITIVSCILVFFRIFFWPKSKNWLLFVISLIAVYWFQTLSSIRYLSFWLPTFMLLISVLTWRIFIQQSKAISIEDKVALSLIFLFPFTFSILKFTGLTEISFISDIPQIHILLIIPGLIIIFLSIFSVKQK